MMTAMPIYSAVHVGMYGYRLGYALPDLQKLVRRCRRFGLSYSDIAILMKRRLE